MPFDDTADTTLSAANVPVPDPTAEARRASVMSSGGPLSSTAIAQACALLTHLSDRFTATQGTPMSIFYFLMLYTCEKNP